MHNACNIWKVKGHTSRLNYFWIEKYVFKKPTFAPVQGGPSGTLPVPTYLTECAPFLFPIGLYWMGCRCCGLRCSNAITRALKMGFTCSYFCPRALLTSRDKKKKDKEKSLA